MNDTITTAVFDLYAAKDETAFNAAFGALQATGIAARDLGTIARNYADTVTRYRSKAAAFADIRRAYIRRARFAQKIAR